LGTPTHAVERGAHLTRWQLDCPDGLTGRRVAVRGVADSATDVVVRLVRADGRASSRVLRGEAAAFLVPATPARFDPLRSYASLGLDHIANGADHLLFLLGLFLLVRGGRALVLTVTAFTAGHAITLGLAVLGVVRVPAAPVEVAIAASLMLLALMLSRGERRRRAPLLFAGGFGLLHGLGFAGALSRAGLPEAQLPLALFAFHVGIEAGQIAFLALCAAVRAVLRGWAPRVVAFGPRVPAYAIGSLAAFWLIERVALLW
jgi:hydrogenase/urease accessory protein HupE